MNLKVKVLRIILLAVLLFVTFKIVLYVNAYCKYQNRTHAITGITTPKMHARYQCIFPWHIGREFKGFDIEGSTSFVCEFRTVWVDWAVKKSLVSNSTEASKE